MIHDLETTLGSASSSGADSGGVFGADQDGRWDELNVAGFGDDLPPGAVDVAVMGWAEQNTIT
jgi:hypothetical protein